MGTPLEILALGLAAASALALVVLVARRTVLARAELRTEAAEQRLRPLAVVYVEGEELGEFELGRADARIFAAILTRYARMLTGEDRARIAAFFERRGYVEWELRRVTRRRPRLRAEAAFALGDMGSGTAIPALVGALADGDREVRTAAARSLGKLEAAEAAPLLVAALATRGVPRAVAGQALISIGAAAAPEVRPLSHDPDDAVRGAAVEMLGLIGGPGDAPVLARAARDPAAWVRAAAMRALARVGGSAETAVVAGALRDRIPFVRTQAANAAARIGDSSLVPTLLAQARGDLYAPAVAAARALVSLAPSELERAAAGPDAGPYLRQAATRARLEAG